MAGRDRLGRKPGADPELLGLHHLAQLDVRLHIEQHRGQRRGLIDQPATHAHGQRLIRHGGHAPAVAPCVPSAGLPPVFWRLPPAIDDSRCAMPLIDHLFSVGAIRKAIWKLWYPFLTRRLHGEEVLFLNYAFETEPPMGLPLSPADEPNRACIQLYHHVATQTGLRA